MADLPQSRHRRRDDRERYSSTARSSYSRRRSRSRSSSRRTYASHSKTDRRPTRPADHRLRPTGTDGLSSSRAQSTSRDRSQRTELSSRPLEPNTAQNSAPTLDQTVWDPDEQQRQEEALIAQRRERRRAILLKHQAKILPAENQTEASSPATTSTASGDTLSSSAPNINPERSASSQATVTPPLHASNGETPQLSSSSTEALRPSTHQPWLLQEKERHEPVNLTPGQSPLATDYQERPSQGGPGKPSPLSAADESGRLQPNEVNSKAEPELGDDDDDDIFAPPSAKRPKMTHTTVDIGSTRLEVAPVLLREARPSLQDNWDDPEGYYRIILGEQFDGRYHVYNNLGKGVFSTVFKARDKANDDHDVAIKVIRSNHTMYRAGQKEIAIINKLAAADPEDRKHCIQLLRHFEYRGHLCLVFESLSMNLRDVLKKYGRDVGLNLKAVRTYAQQLFIALTLLHKCRVLHADIKPDNILVNDAKNLLKLCDFGSASDVHENDITPYLVSRFYRAPEIILGLSYDYAIDVWSVGCTLYELLTGKILFPGRSNNQMLRLMMELKGRFPTRMLKRGQFTGQHFDASFTHFLQYDMDRVLNKEVVRPVVITKPTKDLKARLSQIDHREPPKLMATFGDFLDRCLMLNPEKRMTATEALNHPFISDAKL
ncbi:U4/U6 small nuclear ribonucleoprotein prp4 [Dimargaris verticillata]|uniref:non-specific serine/threonine protein kinase n=1 Tax=Dimargaris verticillata TaxID=2761393 RepID=A0A9W8B0T8_9FUNG|nr:U4/U6 small nuclear ribonucleoprotein prp4 [Dimargaris verticillata]